MLKNCILFVLLFAAVLFLNKAIISLDLMYAEQPMLYAANQALQSSADLFQVYLHPKMLDVFSIPFFRPSGHFLIYQLLTPLLGWHNTQGLIIVNLFFLSLIGFVLIKIYQALFPGFKAGGYLAFAIYLMHPALILPHLIILHFEFAYVFLTLLSFYLFILFCRRVERPLLERRDLRARDLYLLFTAMTFYLLALSFKEPALMLGPVLILYFCLNFYSSQASGLMRSKTFWQTVILLLMISLAAGLYLSLAWPSLQHPASGAITPQRKLLASIELSKIIFGLPRDPSLQAGLHQSQLFWREVQFTPLARAFIGLLFLSLVVGFLKLLRYRSQCLENKVYLKSLLFLFLAALLFLVLPINWAMALPWHLSLTLLFLSLMLGFSCDYLSQGWIKNRSQSRAAVFAMALLVAVITPSVYQANIDHILMKNGFAFRLGHNAVFNPPAIRAKLNADSILVVEDSILHDSYALGNGDYPYYLRKDLDYDEWQKVQAFSTIQRQPIYNGYLFKWAYLMPELREEIYAFDVNQMDKVPDAILHDWLEHLPNIYCVGYDRQANWQDRTEIFRKNILSEQARRFLLVHPYEPLAASQLKGNVLYTKKLAFPTYQVCQYECDQNVQCKGFTYENANYQYHSRIKCQFYDALSAKEPQFCATCVGFIKGTG